MDIFVDNEDFIKADKKSIVRHFDTQIYPL